MENLLVIPTGMVDKKKVPAVLLSLVLVACSALTHRPAITERDPNGESIYLVSHGWHTGLVIRREAIPEGLIPEAGDFGEIRYLEVGWGDRGYYPAGSFSAWLAVKAALWPSASVLHLVGLNQSPERAFPQSEIIALRPSEDGFERLVRYIDRSFSREAERKGIPLGPGLYGGSRFYPSRESFHLFRTCNVWTAGALREAGFTGFRRMSITANQVMTRARMYGTVIQFAQAVE